MENMLWGIARVYPQMLGGLLTQRSLQSVWRSYLHYALQVRIGSPPEAILEFNGALNVDTVAARWRETEQPSSQRRTVRD